MKRAPFSSSLPLLATVTLLGACAAPPAHLPVLPMASTNLSGPPISCMASAEGDFGSLSVSVNYPGDGRSHDPPHVRWQPHRIESTGVASEVRAPNGDLLLYDPAPLAFEFVGPPLAGERLGLFAGGGFSWYPTTTELPAPRDDQHPPAIHLILSYLGARSDLGSFGDYHLKWGAMSADTVGLPISAANPAAADAIRALEHGEALTLIVEDQAGKTLEQSVFRADGMRDRDDALDQLTKAAETYAVLFYKDYSPGIPFRFYPDGPLCATLEFRN